MWVTQKHYKANDFIDCYQKNSEQDLSKSARLWVCQALKTFFATVHSASRYAPLEEYPTESLNGGDTLIARG